MGTAHDLFSASWDVPEKRTAETGFQCHVYIISLVYVINPWIRDSINWHPRNNFTRNSAEKFRRNMELRGTELWETKLPPEFHLIFRQNSKENRIPQRNWKIILLHPIPHMIPYICKNLEESPDYVEYEYIRVQIPISVEYCCTPGVRQSCVEWSPLYKMSLMSGQPPPLIRVYTPPAGTV